MATILVGLDPASATYVKMKQNACARLGMESIAVELSKDTTTEELLDSITKLNNDKNVHGILLQHPVPSQINERICFDAINVQKDVDGVTCFGQNKLHHQHLFEHLLHQSIYAHLFAKVLDAATRFHEHFYHCLTL